MATTAQIEANRRNSQRSTGPKTAEGKARARLNALKHGMNAPTLFPVLPQENPRELEERTQEYLSDIQPRNAIERDLVLQAARLAYQIERSERIETAHLANRVREATQNEEISARRLEQVRQLGRRLLYIVGPEDKSYPNPSIDDDPAVFVRGLEDTAEGCRWLLARWAEFRNLMNHKAWWGTSLMVRFIRLQGKQPVEAFYDPALNSIFLAWDVLAPKTIETFWHLYKKSASLSDPAYKHLLRWDEIAPRPQNQEEASAILHEVVDGHVERLELLLARHESITAEEAAARADRAALDCSKEFERHRRYQSARTRELLRTLDTLRRMRNAELGTGNEEEEMRDDAWRMTNEIGEVEPRGESHEQPQVVNEYLIGGCDEPRSVTDSANEQNQIIPDKEADGDGTQRQSFFLPLHSSSDPSAPRRARNEAKVESTQDRLLHNFKQSAISIPDGERSQSARGETDSKAERRENSIEIHKQSPMTGEGRATATNFPDSLPASGAPRLTPHAHAHQIAAWTADTAFLPCSESEAAAMIRSSHEDESDAVQEFRPCGATGASGDVKGTG
jgi:hypothetical protein